MNAHAAIAHQRQSSGRDGASRQASPGRAQRAQQPNNLDRLAAPPGATGTNSSIGYADISLTATDLPRAEEADEPQAIDIVDEPKDKDERPEPDGRHSEHAPVLAQNPRATTISVHAAQTGAFNIATVLQPRARPQAYLADRNPGNLDPARSQNVAPGGVPTEGAGSNDCTPSTASATLAWDVVEADANNWRVDVQSLTLVGHVNVKPWPSDPSNMTVPNTANPVDGGNIEDKAGSSNHWQTAIDDMANYHQANGGAGPNWHSTDASHAHEWAHWNTDYVADSVGSVAGGNWPKTNTDLDALRQPKASSPTAAAAKAALTARVNTRLGTWRTRTSARWRAIPDTPGVAGSTGYVAGAAVLAGLIDSVRAFAVRKGWTRAPAMPVQPRPGRDIPP